MTTSPSRALRALIIAEAANPEWVSVPLVGWSLASALRDVVDAHIVTQVRNRDAFLRAGLQEGRDFTAVDSEAIAAPLARLGGLLRMGKGKGWTMTTALASLAYPYFERVVWRRFGDDLRAGRFDVVHRVTPLSPTAPSPLAARCRAAGTPFILGPLNGGVPWPAGFEAERRREQEWLSYVRGAYKWLPGRLATLDAASIIIAGSRHTASEIPAQFAPKLRHMPENGVDPARFNLVAPHSPDGPLVGCFVGRLVPYKGPDMLIEAAAPLLASGRMRLDIVGDGPLGGELRQVCARLGVADAVAFHGWVPHAGVQTILSQAHVLAFPSVREFGGGVVLEAMALGVPPIVVDYAGPGELVAPEFGFKIPPGGRAQIVAGTRDALERAAADRGALITMGELARREVAERHTWTRKAEMIAEFYAEACAKGAR